MVGTCGHDLDFSSDLYKVIENEIGREVTYPEGTSILGGRGAWPQNLPLKFLLEPKILPPKIKVTNTPNFTLRISDMTPKLGLFPNFCVLW